MTPLGDLPSRRDVGPTRVVPQRGWRLADALAHRSGIDDAATDFGRSAAQDGDRLDMCLAELDATHHAVEGTPAPRLVVRRVALAWADAVQEHLDGVACADRAGTPSDLGGVEDLEASLALLYRAAGDGWLADTDLTRTHALAVVDLAGVRTDVAPGFSRLEAALRRAAAAELVRDRLPTSTQVAELNAHRLVALVRRTSDLQQRLAEVVDTLGRRLQASPSGGGCRSWTEDLPLGPDAARALLDELAG